MVKGSRGKKTREQLEVENLVLRRSRMAEGGWSVIRTGIKWLVLGFIVLQFRFSVDALAGQHTDASFMARVLVSTSMNQWLAWVLVVGFGGWAQGERFLRRR